MNKGKVKTDFFTTNTIGSEECSPKIYPHPFHLFSFWNICDLEIFPQSVHFIMFISSFRLLTSSWKKIGFCYVRTSIENNIESLFLEKGFWFLHYCSINWTKFASDWYLSNKILKNGVRRDCVACCILWIGSY